MRESIYRNYLLGVLLIILAFNFADRLALGLVLQDIKVDLHVTDTQLGLLTGLAFALFYSLMGIPIARWADRGNRVMLIGITVALWGVALALSGMAASFSMLLLIRIGVAVGEAGCIPPAHSLIADYFTRAVRPRAVAIYMLGVPLSTIFGYFVAGRLNVLYGWRVMFMALGLPGLALAALAGFTLREPRRWKAKKGGQNTVAANPSSNPKPAERSVAVPGIESCCVTLWANRTFRHLLFCFSVIAFFGYGIAAWQPAFLIRSYGLTTGEIGICFAAIFGLGGTLGTYLGGELACRRAANNERFQLIAMAIVCSILSVISACIYLAPNYYVAFSFMGLTAFGGTTTSGPLFATIQTLVPNDMRAMSIAGIYLFSNLIGLGLGPLAAGALSDALRPLLGEESLRYSLLALCPGYLWAAWHLWRASKTVTDDLQAAESNRGINILEEESVPVRSSARPSVT